MELTNKQKQSYTTIAPVNIKPTAPSNMNFDIIHP